jgi:trk system potassium uptake protein TrkA
MHVIVIGCGKVGAKFAQVLSEEGHDVVIVDSDRNAFKALSPDFNGITIAGIPIDQDVLKQAGIETADAIAAVTPDDNVNIMTCQVAKEIFKVPKVIARIYNPTREHVFHHFGLDTICPTNITVDVIRSIVLGEAGITDHTIGGTRVSFRYEKVTRAEEGKKLGAVKVDNKLLLFGVMRNGSLSLAQPEMILNREDILVIAEKPE